jgi:hypothetical protein
MPHRFPRRSVAVAAVAAALAFSTPAMAASNKPKSQKFTAQGLVVASTSSTLRVLTRQLKVGSASLAANTVVTVKRPSGKGKKSNASLVGYTVTVSGSAAKSGKTLILAASTEVAQPQPAEVFLGVVTAVTPTGLMLQEASAAGGDDFGDDQNSLTVDTSAATVSVDGAAGTVDADEFVIVLGERDADIVVAATVDAYTTPPDVEAGRISAITGPMITLGDEWGDDQGGDGEHHGDDGNDGRGGSQRRARMTSSAKATVTDDPAPGASPDPSASQPGDDVSPGDDQSTTLDLTSAPIVFNGGTTVDVSMLTSGERIVVLGETNADTGDFTAQIAFAFNQQDLRPATHHHHED